MTPTPPKNGAPAGGPDGGAYRCVYCGTTRATREQLAAHQGGCVARTAREREWDDARARFERRTVRR